MSSRGRRAKAGISKNKVAKKGTNASKRRNSQIRSDSSDACVVESIDIIEEIIEDENVSMLCEAKFTERSNPDVISDKNSKIVDQRLKARERMARKRADPEYAMKERERAREAKAKKRKDPAFLEFERAKNREMMALKRQDPEYASRERERARVLMALKRKDEDFAKIEREMNRHRVALKRKDPDYRAKTVQNGSQNSDSQS